MPVIGAMLEALSGACRQVPQKNTAQQTSTSASDTIMQSLRPEDPNRTTSVSTPMCAFSRARENAHMGVETLVVRFGSSGRRLCMIVSDALVLVCCAVFFWGTWRQAPLNASNIAPITGISMLWIYGIGFFTSVGIALLTLVRLWRALTGRLGERELAEFAGELDVGDAASLKRHLE